MKILVVGDSFAADWACYDNSYPGWVNLLADEHNVVNRAQAGVGEYKVWLQIAQENLDHYDLTIICHTSSYRVHVESHPFYPKSIMHKNADLIYSDIMERGTGEEREHIRYYFENIFDLNYALDIHNLIKERIMYYTLDRPVIHMSFFPVLKNEFVITHELNFHDIWKQYPGKINHLNAAGNNIVFSKIKVKINDFQ